MRDVTAVPAEGPELRTTGWPGRTVLGRLPANSLAALLAAGTLRQYPAGSALLMEGDSSTGVFLLIDGWVKVTGTTEEGGLALLALRSRGDLVGEQAALDNKPRSATVTSAGVTVAREIHQSEFLRLLAEYSDVSMAVTHALSAKLRWATRRRIDFSGLSANVRLARVLSELAQLDSRQTTQGLELGYELTQPELAAMVGASEPSVHRALRQLRAAGAVETGYRRIIIRDLPMLDEIAGLVRGDGSG
jgi:CRP/FNR family transcriptional regulator, cyclic AMP receptor protein